MPQPLNTHTATINLNNFYYVNQDSNISTHLLSEYDNRYYTAYNKYIINDTIKNQIYYKKPETKDYKLEYIEMSIKMISPFPLKTGGTYLFIQDFNKNFPSYSQRKTVLTLIELENLLDLVLLLKKRNIKREHIDIKVPCRSMNSKKPIRYGEISRDPILISLPLSEKFINSFYYRLNIIKFTEESPNYSFVDGEINY